MWVLKRTKGQSIAINTMEIESTLTIVTIDAETRRVTILVKRLDQYRDSSFEIAIGQSYRLTDEIEISLIDIGQSGARFGITAPETASVHRLEHLQQMKVKLAEEISEEIRKKLEEQNDENEDGGATAPVPRPPSTKPPSLGAILKEPRADDD